MDSVDVKHHVFVLIYLLLLLLQMQTSRDGGVSESSQGFYINLSDFETFKKEEANKLDVLLHHFEEHVRVLPLSTLRASLSGTFLQTLPDLVTPLKGHSIFISAQLSMQRRGQRPPKGSGTNMTVDAT